MTSSAEERERLASILAKVDKEELVRFLARSLSLADLQELVGSLAEEGLVEVEDEDEGEDEDEDELRLSVKLTNTGDGMVTCWCDDREAAMLDQTIMGARWEGTGGEPGAYAVIMDSPDLVERLEADGYAVDDSEYSAPEKDESVR